MRPGGAGLEICARLRLVVAHNAKNTPALIDVLVFILLSSLHFSFWLMFVAPFNKSLRCPISRGKRLISEFYGTSNCNLPHPMEFANSNLFFQAADGYG